MKVRRLKDAFEKPFRNKTTSALQATSQQLHTNEERNTENQILQGEEELLLQELERQEVAEGSRRGVRHSFGSAADMPPPPVPKGPQVRQASPVQLIERNNSAEFLVDPRLAKKKTRTATEDEDVDYRPGRAESPVWDIELDLNDD